MTLRFVLPVYACFAFASLAAAQTAQNWSGFRGPNQDGISTEKNLPVEWSDTKNLVWKTPLPGPGASSPVTWDDRIYLTCYTGYGVDRAAPGKYENLKRQVICLSRTTGKIVWDDLFANKAADDHYGDFTNLHGYASSTPAVDESGLYIYFGTNGLRAYTHDGKLRWEKSCGEKYSNFGSASSPVIVNDLVIVNASVESSAIIAFDKKTGDEVWRAPVTAQSRSTPLWHKYKGAQAIVVNLASAHESSTKQGMLAALDVRTGKQLWECVAVGDYLNPSPTAVAGVVFAGGGSPNQTVAIRTGGQGDVTDTHKLWDIKLGTEVGTPVYYEGHLYWAHETEGIAYCVDARTGEVKYKERLKPRPDRIYASGIIADGKLHYVSRENGTYVLAASPKFELLAHNTFASDQSIFNATPAVSRGQLLLRSDKALYCVGKK